MTDMAPPRTGRGVWIWAITATVLAIVFFNLTLLFFVRWQRAAVEINPVGPDGSRRAVSGEFSFADLQDSDVAGQYRYYERTNLMGTIKLLPDHTIINKDGTKYPRYYWEIQPEGILTRWQRADVVFNVREGPGVYVARRGDGIDYRRIEKIEDSAFE